MKRFWRWLGQGFEPRLALSTSLFLAFIVLFATVICYRPLAVALKEKSDEIRAERMKLIRHKRLVAQKDAFREELSGYEERFTRKRSHDEEVGTYLKELESLLTGAGLNINEIRPIPTEEKAKLDVLSIEVTAEGGMENLVNFLHSVAASPDLLDVRSLSVLRRRTGEGRLAVTAEVTKTLFVP